MLEINDKELFTHTLFFVSVASFFLKSANQKGKNRVLTILREKFFPLIGVSAFQKDFYKDLTRKRPGKINFSANQRCPVFRVSANWKEDCIRKIYFTRRGCQKYKMYLKFNSNFFNTFTADYTTSILVVGSERVK